MEHHTVHGSHVAFANECLAVVEASLQDLLGPGPRCVTLRRAEVTAALEELHDSEHGRDVQPALIS